MDHPRRALPQVEPVEDRVAPSHGGFDPGPAPDHPGGPAPALVRDHPNGFDHAGPFVGTAPAHRGPGAEFVVLRVVPVQAATPARPADAAPRLVVAPALADPAGAAPAGTYLPPSSDPAPAPGPVAAPGRGPAAGVLVEAAAAGVRAAAFTATTITAVGTDESASPGEVVPVPSPPETAAPTAPAWEFPPLSVELADLRPLAGALGIDVAAVESGVRQALDFAADFAPIPADGWGADGWVAAAAVLAGGAGWVGVRARRRVPAPDAVFLGWGDAR